MANYSFWRDASHRLTFELSEAPPDSYKPLCQAIAAKFGLIPSWQGVTDGYDIIFQDYARGNEIVGLEWDNWTRFTVVAKSLHSEPLVRQIGTWLLQSDSANRE